MIYMLAPEISHTVQTSFQYIWIYNYSYNTAACSVAFVILVDNKCHDGALGNILIL